MPPKPRKQRSIWPSQSKNKVLQARALDALADIQLDQKNYSAVEKTIAQIETLELSLKKPDYKRIAACARKLGTAFLNSERPGGGYEGL